MWASFGSSFWTLCTSWTYVPIFFTGLEKFFYWFEREGVRERDTGRDINLFFHLFTHSLVDFVFALVRIKPAILVYQDNALTQQSPTFLAPGTYLVEDNFSMDWGSWDGFRVVQAHYIQAHLLLCCPVPNSPRPALVHSPEVGNLCSNQLSYLVRPREVFCHIFPNRFSIPCFLFSPSGTPMM